MKLKIKKLLFSLCENSRRKTKELAKLTRSSQQSASYLVKQYKKKNYIQSFTTIIDPVKFGFINIVVGFDFLNLEYSKKRIMLQELSSNANIILIEENQQGVDLLVEYSVLNMSAFNKIHSEIIKRFRGEISAKFIYPIIVKHRFEKNYLVRKPNEKDIILCGDREKTELTENEKNVLTKIFRHPDKSISQIAVKTGLTSKTVMKIKANLEKNSIIKGYSCILNHSKLGIIRHHIFLNFKDEGVEFIDKFVQFARMHKNIVTLVKLLGHYQVMITVEELKSVDVLRQIRAEFPTLDYLVLKSEKILKKHSFPLEDWIKY
ncbi:MAG: hypothetical protein ACOCQX_01130 [Candidatus Nanoarchaeia archaeon]